MIGTISPLVQVAPRQWRSSITLYVLGSISGGAVAFAALAFLGHLMLGGIGMSGRWAVAGICSMPLAASQLGVIRLPMPWFYRAVPQRWWVSLGRRRASFLYGLVLGIGLTTSIPFYTYFIVLLWTILQGDPVYGLIVGVVYGFARALPVLIAGAWVKGQVDSPTPYDAAGRVTDYILAGRRSVQSLTGTLGVVFAAALLSAYVVTPW